jgi:osmotically-inducible protein OsmY
LKVRFRPGPERSVAGVQSRLERQINRSRRISRVAGEEISIVIDGDTATITGTVETEYDRDRAVGFVRLEPRITQIVDGLAVANPDTADGR